MDQRQINEQKHNKKILDRAESVWGRSSVAGKVRVARRAQMIINHCRLQPGRRVLEIGCGTGTLTAYLAQTGVTVVAMDVFDDFLVQARQQVPAANVEFVSGDAETLLDFPAATFDAVCGLSILHHLRLSVSLDNIYRVLAPGGLIAFSEPNMLNPQIALQKNIPWLKRRIGDSPDETAFFRWRLRRDLINHHFKAVVVQPFDFLHPSLPDRAVAAVNAPLGYLEQMPLIREIAGSLFIKAKK